MEPAPELAELLPGLGHPDSQVRSANAAALGALGADGVPAIGPLIAVCSDTDMCVRGEAVHSLGEIAASLAFAQDADGLAALAGAVPTLMTLLGDESSDVRCGAADLLAKLGSAALAAVPRLHELLVDPGAGLTADPQNWSLATHAGFVREAARRALERIGGRADPGR